VDRRSDASVSAFAFVATKAIAVTGEPIRRLYLLPVPALVVIVIRIPNGCRIVGGVRVEERYDGHGVSPAVGLGASTAHKSTVDGCWVLRLDGQTLDLPDECINHALSTFTLCAIPDVSERCGRCAGCVSRACVCLSSSVPLPGGRSPLDLMGCKLFGTEKRRCRMRTSRLM
jgi:hypothetical protein